MLELILLASIGNISPIQKEVWDATQFIQAGQLDPRYIQFFSTYAIPDGNYPSLRHKAELVQQFTINSLQSYKSHGLIAKARRVPGTSTLWWIDTRDVGWEIKSVEKVNSIEPYFREPWVHFFGYTINIFRTDWFIAQSLDVMLQVDNGDDIKIYYELIYGDDKPKNIAEFRKLWGINLSTLQFLKLDKGVVIDKGHSGVSRNNRQLLRVRTATGYYWETADVKNHEDERDYIENIPLLQDKFVKDASEIITTNKVQLQTYFLTNGEGNVVDFADPTLVIDRGDTQDIRVRTAKSCVVCHVNGINNFISANDTLRAVGVRLRVKSKDNSRDVKRFYSDELSEIVDDDNRLYARSIKKCNNLTPELNTQYVADVYNWYRSPVSLEQASIECGVTQEEYKEVCGQSVSGRVLAITRGLTTPRISWENKKGGTFAVSMLLLSVGRKPIPYSNQVITLIEAPVMYNNRIITTLPSNTKYDIMDSVLQDYTRYFSMKTNTGKTAFVNAQCVRRIPKDER